MVTSQQPAEHRLSRRVEPPRRAICFEHTHPGASVMASGFPHYPHTKLFRLVESGSELSEQVERLLVQRLDGRSTWRGAMFDIDTEIEKLECCASECALI